MGYTAAVSLRPQPGQHEERECQHQRSSAEIKPRTRADRRSSLIQWLPGLIGHRPSAMATLLLAGVAETAGSAAITPIAAGRMAGVSDCAKGRRVNRLVARKS